MADRVTQLIDVLLDESADIAERDDAAIDLGEYDDDRALAALAQVAVMTDSEILASSCGESLAQMWIRKGSFDPQTVHSLHGPAKRELRELFSQQRPDWLDLLD
jgi:hypothetical protein